MDTSCQKEAPNSPHDMHVTSHQIHLDPLNDALVCSLYKRNSLRAPKVCKISLSMLLNIVGLKLLEC